MIGGGYEDVYSNPVINEIVMPLQHSIVGGSLLVNGLILTLILRQHGKAVGTYRYLLACFAINDIVYTILHYVTFPVPETFPNVFIIRGHGPSFSIFWLSMYMGNYATGFPLLVSHFLYRLMALKWPQVLDHFFKLLPIALVVTFLCGTTWFTSTYVFMEQDAESTTYMQPIFNGEVYSPVIHSPQRGRLYVVCVYWTEGTFKGGRTKNFIALFLLIVVMCAAYVIKHT
ncbi:hypothetical protein PENTCL1PPCAC_14310 [Pristionchus entomophagus]|uniref:G protein-coupled receptor n=1 Tax=Pristionchus entomophagus TaxID=358040 RepID=A0AAV5T979_9BILA|nr:hypothetical protein PENTCL1PPCAC_14310 [Pristionchus entomophagus]